MDDKSILELRARQKNEVVDHLKAEVAILDRERLGLLRQYVDLAHRHGLQTLDPVKTDAIPIVDRVQEADAQRLHLAAVVAGVLGSVVFGGLSIVALAIGTPLTVFIISTLFAAAVGVVVVALMIFTTRSSPRNPDARRSLAIWAAGFGVIMLTSLTLFAWLRFINDLTLLNYLAYSIAGFEIGMFGLAAAFESASHIYDWSRGINARFNEISTAIDKKLSTIRLEQQDLDELRFRMDALRQTPEATTDDEEVHR